MITKQQLEQVLSQSNISPCDRKRVIRFIAFGKRSKLEGFFLLGFGIFAFAGFILSIYQFITGSDAGIDQAAVGGFGFVCAGLFFWESYSYLNKLNQSRAIAKLLADANQSMEPIVKTRVDSVNVQGTQAHA